jgi:hypothetical protein
MADITIAELMGKMPKALILKKRREWTICNSSSPARKPVNGLQ